MRSALLASKRALAEISWPPQRCPGALGGGGLQNRRCQEQITASSRLAGVRPGRQVYRRGIVLAKIWDQSPAQLAQVLMAPVDDNAQDARHPAAPLCALRSGQQRRRSPRRAVVQGLDVCLGSGGGASQGSRRV